MILENYESVAERIEKFWNHYLGIGRIDTELVYQDGTRYIVKALAIGKQPILCHLPQDTPRRFAAMPTGIPSKMQRQAQLGACCTQPAFLNSQMASHGLH
jgi:hypothetical protein